VALLLLIQDKDEQKAQAWQACAIAAIVNHLNSAPIPGKVSVGANDQLDRQEAE
jgi:hypothetical protein